MINISRFIAEQVIKRSSSLFLQDLKQNHALIAKEIEGKRVLVIGGAGSIGSSFIKAVLPFKPTELVVVDLSENGLAELTRDLRSTYRLYVPHDYRTYAIDFANPIFEHLFRENSGFDIVANFSAHKHVRSEKDRYSVQALLENNLIKAKKLLDLLALFPPEHFFCVSTDKAANPVNIMGASKRIMEDLIMSYSDQFNVTTARFANVAFSNGSLPDGWIARVMKRQPLTAPNDVKRYFVSPEESGQICMMACVLGKNREIFFPKLGAGQMMKFSDICDRFIKALGYAKIQCASEEEAKRIASTLTDDATSYPVYYSGSDTTGEKPYEEFYAEDEKINADRFTALGVIEEIQQRASATEVNRFLDQLERIFADPDFCKEEIISAIKDYLPNFEHEEKGKNLDEKM